MSLIWNITVLEVHSSLHKSHLCMLFEVTKSHLCMLFEVTLVPIPSIDCKATLFLCASQKNWDDPNFPMSKMVAAQIAQCPQMKILRFC